MKTEGKKKLPLTIKILIVLAAFAAVTFALALSAAIVSVNRTIGAIEDIGVVAFTEESREKILTAESYYDSLDANLNLQNRITNKETLTQAKLKYISLAVWELHLADQANADGANDSEVKKLAQEIRTTYEEFFAADVSSDIPNFHYLPEAEAKYSGNGGGADETAPAEEEQQDDIELC